MVLNKVMRFNLSLTTLYDFRSLTTKTLPFTIKHFLSSFASAGSEKMQENNLLENTSLRAIKESS